MNTNSAKAFCDFLIEKISIYQDEVYSRDWESIVEKSRKIDIAQEFEAFIHAQLTLFEQQGADIKEESNEKITGAQFMEWLQTNGQ